MSHVNDPSQDPGRPFSRDEVQQLFERLPRLQARDRVERLRSALWPGAVGAASLGLLLLWFGATPTAVTPRLVPPPVALASPAAPAEPADLIERPATVGAYQVVRLAVPAPFFGSLEGRVLLQSAGGWRVRPLGLAPAREGQLRYEGTVNDLLGTAAPGAYAVVLLAGRSFRLPAVGSTIDAPPVRSEIWRFQIVSSPL